MPLHHYHWKEEIVIAPPGQVANWLMIYLHSSVERDIDIEVTKAKIKLMRDKIYVSKLKDQKVKFKIKDLISQPTINI